MKLKINIEKYSNYSSDVDKEVITKEIEFDDKMFDEITRPLKTKKKVKKCLWCATFNQYNQFFKYNRKCKTYVYGMHIIRKSNSRFSKLCKRYI